MTGPDLLRKRAWRAPAVIALAAWVAIVCRLDPSGSYPGMPQGPGLTVDESFNVQQGARLAITIPAWIRGELTWREVFGEPEDIGPQPPAGHHLADHPPLGRLLLGVAHQATWAVAPPADPGTPFVTAAARTGAAAAFALTVFLVGLTAARWYGTAAGVIAACSLVLMPRVFGHAHLASLESFIGLAYAATVLCVASSWARTGADETPKRLTKGAAVGGILFGLALLSKIQAVFLPIPIAAWALWHWRQRALLPLAVFGGVGLAVFFVGWPWLWFDPVDHLLRYLGRTTGRIPLNVWYLGEKWADTQVPWHYPSVMFAVTVPLGLHLLGLLGVFARGRGAWRDRREQLVLASTLFPLLVFSVPGVAVYDGARLFLVAFPLWAVLIGRGAATALDWLRNRLPRRVPAAVLGLFLLLQGWGLLAVAPCYLSYYNLLVGGLPGASRLGFEPTYWGDSVTRELLEELVRRVPRGATVAVAPVLHQFQVEELVNQSPILRRHGVRLKAHDGEPDWEYLLTFERRADLPESLRRPENAETVAKIRRHGVPLAAVHRQR